MPVVGRGHGDHANCLGNAQVSGDRLGAVGLLRVGLEIEELGHGAGGSHFHYRAPNGRKTSIVRGHAEIAEHPIPQ